MSKNVINDRLKENDDERRFVLTNGISFVFEMK